jgi:tetratricopeptide (TPR) repeat protein
MLVTLPFVLLLLDYWPLERFGSKGEKAGSKRSLIYLLIEKIPLFAMVLASSVVTFIVQREGRTVASQEGCGFLIRLANAPISYLQYIIKMIWPARLAVFYPHPGQNISFLYAAISAVLLLAVTIVILRFAKKRRYLVTGWFWYLGTLVPVIGLVQVGYQAMADRYSYITLTGLFIIIAWGVAELFTKWTSANLSRQTRRRLVEPRGKKITLTLSAMLIILAMSICTHLQLRHWRSNVSLFQHALDVTEDNHLAHLHVAQFLYAQRRFDEAIREYQKALQIAPTNVEALQVFCDILVQQDRDDEAVKYLTQALQIKPDLNEIRLFLGTTLANKGKFAYAAKEYEEFLRTRPQNAIAHNDFGIILFRQGKFDQAIEHFKQAIQINPDYTIAKNNLNSALAERQKLQDKDAEKTEK